MKLVLLLFVALFIPSVVFAADWTVASSKLKDSVVFIEFKTPEGGGSCSGFVVDQAKNYVMTAAHCFGTDMMVDSKPSKRVVSRDGRKDLMIIEVPELDKPAMTVAKEDPLLGEELASYGYGYGLELPFLKFSHVAAVNLHIDYQGIGGPLLAVDTPYVGGMSGGPLVNGKGEVVGIVQLATDAIGFGVGSEVLRDKMGRYFEKK